MANRIQFRRDTSANWTRVNPILEDGEPGLETDTNYIKYGDGNTAWADLDYASTGDIFDEDGALNLTNRGVVRNQGSGKDVNIVANGFAQLQWTTVEGVAEANPNGTDELLNWIYVESGGTYIETNVNGPGDSHEWRFDTDGNLTLPRGSKILESTYLGTDSIILKPNGGTSTQYLEIAPTAVEGNHIHLMAGSGTELFLGNDNQYVKLADTGGVVINSDDGMGNTAQWTFDNDGTLTTPGNVTIGAGWGNISMVDTISANNYVYANGVSILSGLGSNYGNTEVAAYLASGEVQTAQIHGNLTVGNLTVNGNITYIGTNSYVVTDNIVQFADGNPADTLDLGFTAHRTVDSQLQHTGLIRDASAGNWKLFSNVTAQPGTTVDFTDAVYDDLVVGNITSPTINLLNANASTQQTLISSLQSNAATQSDLIIGINANVTAANVGIKGYIDSQNFYSNVKVADYLSTYSSNIGNVKTTANVVTTQYFIGNGAFLTGIVTTGSGTNYSDANVQAYLSGSVTGIIPASAYSNTLGNTARPWGNFYTYNLDLMGGYFKTNGTGGTSGQILKSTGDANPPAWSNIADVISASNVSYLFPANISATNVTSTGNITATGYIVTAGGFGNISQVDTITANTVNSTSSIRVGGNIAVNGPAFSAYANTAVQTITTGTQQKVQFQVEEYDTNSNFANSRFTPTASGIYQFNAQVRFDGSYGTGESMIVLYKNGAEHKRGWNASGVNWASTLGAMTISTQAIANGTGDFFEIYVQQTSGGNLSITTVNNPAITWFNGCMLRGL